MTSMGPFRWHVPQAGWSIPTVRQLIKAKNAVPLLETSPIDKLAVGIP